MRAGSPPQPRTPRTRAKTHAAAWIRSFLILKTFLPKRRARLCQSGALPAQIAAISCFKAPLVASRFLHDLLVDDLDVAADAVAVFAQRVLGHRLLVLRRELLLGLSLDFLQPRAARRAFFYRGDELGQIAAEESEMLLRHHAAVAGDEAVEVVLLQRVQGLHPVLGITIVEKRHPVDQRVAGRDQLFLRQVDEYVAVGVGAPEHEDLDLAPAFVQ